MVIFEIIGMVVVAFAICVGTSELINKVELKRKRRCPECGEPYKLKDNYCSKYGHPL